MNAPDKIYMPNELLTEEWQRHIEGEDTAYIRKDALLEWAERLKEKWEEPPMSRHSPGCVFMLERLIDKLNSM